MANLLFEHTREFAIWAHGDQKYGDQPYWVHLDAVHSLAATFDAPLAVQIAAYLHDVLEDTTMTADYLRDRFGNEVTSLVSAVTKIPGLSRRGGLDANLRRVCDGGRNARLLKLCDRIANVQASKANNPKLFKMYQDEAWAFKNRLFVRDGLGKDEHPVPWAMLDELCES
jgi:guanosine-3',5'-bis(diphosphate) 3'-pyrophosphohydrolase